ncbi:GGDEF domain-containing response regulator [Pleionea sediminis]|uniref:GGDEF domain-containing response regulator n=1 Tax=Pleionea sediminis TaxID=2569479 RepID=UPI00118519FC|nr:GGDEF domain-containing response regulator [Pleionea sediminis]
MNSITLIEPSPTLRFGLNRLLQQLKYRVQSFDSYSTFFDFLQQSPDQISELLVIGWPSKSRQQQKDLVKLVSESPVDRLPLLVFARNMEEPNIDLLADRPNTVIQLWKDFRNSESIIQQLMNRSSFSKEKLQEENTEDKPKVLLVDDSKSVRRIYGKQLEKLGLEVTVATDAENAWDILQENTFDLAIIDYFMPGANGAMLCQRMSESEAHQSILKTVLTGTYKEEVIEECLNSGAQECMFKNESMKLFRTRVSSMIKQIASQQRLDQQKLHLQSILKSVGEGIYGVDEVGRVTFINPAGLRILNYTEQNQLLGQYAHKRFHFADEFGRNISDETNYLYQAYLLKDSLDDWETIFWTADKQPIHVECTIHPLNHLEKTQGSVIVFKNISERKLIEDELNWQLNHDHLTQLLNRTYFDQLLEQEAQSIRVTRLDSALLYIDLDNFKMINDEAGHAAGDQLLVTIGEKIRSRLRHRDLAARLGGDEFAVLLHDTPKTALKDLAESFKDVLSGTSFTIEDQDYSVSGSIGVTTISVSNNDRKQLLAQADYACKKAKSQGKNQVYIFSDEDNSEIAQSQSPGWRARIEKGLSNDNFKLLFQPIFNTSDIDLKALEIIKGKDYKQWVKQNCIPAEYETFVRLEFDDGKLFTPGAFLSDAERFDLISRVDYWVLQELVKTLSSYQTAPIININVSAQTLLDNDVSNKLLNLLEAHPKLCPQFQFELREHHLLHYREQLIPILDDMVGLGCRFQVDDFGRNFSLFSKIRELPINGIKIDGLFTQNIAWDPVDKKLMHSMAEVARSSGVKTTVKAIENIEALQNIEQGGIDLVQGYFLASPENALWIEKN